MPFLCRFFSVLETADRTHLAHNVFHLLQRAQRALEPGDSLPHLKRETRASVRRHGTRSTRNGSPRCWPSCGERRLGRSWRCNERVILASHLEQIVGHLEAVLLHLCHKLLGRRFAACAAASTLGCCCCLAGRPTRRLRQRCFLRRSLLFGGGFLVMGFWCCLLCGKALLRMHFVLDHV